MDFTYVFIIIVGTIKKKKLNLSMAESPRKDEKL